MLDCGRKCALDKRCKGAFYQPHTKSCVLKNAAIWAKKLRTRKDPNRKWIGIRLLARKTGTQPKKRQQPRKQPQSAKPQLAPRRTGRAGNARVGEGSEVWRRMACFVRPRLRNGVGWTSGPNPNPCNLL